MRCEQFEDRLNELLDRRANPLGDQPLTHHAEQCSDCRGLLDTQRLVLSILEHRRLERQTSPWATATSRPRHRPLHRPVHAQRQKTAWLALLTAACVAALLVSSWIAKPGPRPDGGDGYTVAFAPSLQDSPPLPAAVAPSPLPLQRPPFQLSASTLSGTYGSWGKWRELDLGWLLSESEVPRLSKAQLLDRVRQVGGTIRPLTSSVSSTLSILKRTWPGTQTQAKTSADQAVIPSESNLFA